MKTFSGFAAGESKSVSVIDQFFTELLPLIDDLLELKVTLACFRLFDQKAGLALWTTVSELTSDPALGDGVNKAIARGSIVGAVDQSGQQWLFANNELGRAAADAIAHGEKIESIPSIKLRPNIFVLYEQTVGTLTPIIAEQLRDAELEFPHSWIEDAFREAARQNARSWAYVEKILMRRSHREKRDGKIRRDVAADWQRILQENKRKR
jgi:DNA replication protein